MPKPHAATLKPTPHRKTRFALALDTDGVAQLSVLAAHVGQAEFYTAAVEFLASLIDADVSVAFLYSVNQRPRYLAVKAEAALRRGARDAAYLDGPYVLDPVYQMFQRGQADGAYPMASYLPGDFYDSEFYRCFFRNTHLVDTVDVLWRIDEGSAIAFCLGREEGTPPFGDADVALVQHILPLLFALMKRHHQLAACTPPKALSATSARASTGSWRRGPKPSCSRCSSSAFPSPTPTVARTRWCAAKDRRRAVRTDPTRVGPYAVADMVDPQPRT